jgi:hypothetical protein
VEFKTPSLPSIPSFLNHLTRIAASAKKQSAKAAASSSSVTASQATGAAAASSAASSVPAQELSRPLSVYNCMLLRLRHREQVHGQVQLAQIGGDWSDGADLFTDESMQRGALTWTKCFGVLLRNGWVEQQKGGRSGKDVQVKEPGLAHLQRVYAKFPALLAPRAKLLSLEDIKSRLSVSARPSSAQSAVAVATTGAAAAAAVSSRTASVRCCIVRDWRRSRFLFCSPSSLGDCRRSPSEGARAE